MNLHYFFALYAHFPPLLFLAIAFILGISWHFNNYSISIIVIFIAPTISIIFYKLLYNKLKKTHLYLYTLLCLSFIGGALRLSYINYNYHQFYKTVAYKKLKSPATVVDYQEVEDKTFKATITLYLHSYNKMIKIYTNTISELNTGDSIYINNLMLLFPKDKSIVYYHQKEGLAGSIFISKLSFQSYTISKSMLFFLQNKIITLRNDVSTRLKYKFSPHTFQLFSSLFLSKPTNRKHFKKTKQHFSNWGIAHYLARSGLHIMLIVALLFLFIRFIPVPYYLKHSIVIIMLLSYALLTWPTVSFMRALITILLYSLTYLRNIPVYPLHTLSLTCILALLYNPLYLFALDFQLSFSLTFALAWLIELKKRKKINYVKTIDQSI